MSRQDLERAEAGGEDEVTRRRGGERAMVQGNEGVKGASNQFLERLRRGARAR